MILNKQAKSRRRLQEAVVGYVNLRAADGPYSDIVSTHDRLGRKVVVFIKLDIVSEEG